eukprot:Rmarinus@m.886
MDDVGAGKKHLSSTSTVKKLHLSSKRNQAWDIVAEDLNGPSESYGDPFLGTSPLCNSEKHNIPGSCQVTELSGSKIPGSDFLTTGHPNVSVPGVIDGQPLSPHSSSGFDTPQRNSIMSCYSDVANTRGSIKKAPSRRASVDSLTRRNSIHSFKPYSHGTTPATRPRSPTAYPGFGRPQLLCIEGMGVKISMLNTLENTSNHYVRRLWWNAFFGVMVMVVELEVLQIVYDNHPGNLLTTILKSIITLSTIILCYDLWRYYLVRWEVCQCRRNYLIDDPFWNSWHVWNFTLELIILSLHVPPFLDTSWGVPVPLPHDARSRRNNEHFLVSDHFGLLMFLRLYLLPRFLKSRTLLGGQAARFVGNLNNVNFDFQFIIKTLLHSRPVECLLSVSLVGTVACAYGVSVCESGMDSEVSSYYNAAWMIVITITTVGFGELVPMSHCGRLFTFTAAVLSFSISALLVAVISQKLQLTKAEHRVIQFLEKDRWRRSNQVLAARCIQTCWRYTYARGAHMERHQLTHLPVRKEPWKIMMLRRQWLKVMQLWETFRGSYGLVADSDLVINSMIENLFISLAGLEDSIFTRLKAATTDRRENTQKLQLAMTENLLRQERLEKRVDAMLERMESQQNLMRTLVAALGGSGVVENKDASGRGGAGRL